MKRWVVFAVLLLLPQIMVFAEDSYNGHDLYRLWQAYERVDKHTVEAPSDISSSGAYMGYVRGVSESFKNFDALSGVKNMFLIPKNSTMKDVSTAVGRYLEGHKEQLDAPATWLVLEALEGAFPPPPK